METSRVPFLSENKLILSHPLRLRFCLPPLGAFAGLLLCLVSEAASLEPLHPHPDGLWVRRAQARLVAEEAYELVTYELDAGVGSSLRRIRTASLLQQVRGREGGR